MRKYSILWHQATTGIIEHLHVTPTRHENQQRDRIETHSPSSHIIHKAAHQREMQACFGRSAVTDSVIFMWNEVPYSESSEDAWRVRDHKYRVPPGNGMSSPNDSHFDCKAESLKYISGRHRPRPRLGPATNPVYRSVYSRTCSNARNPLRLLPRYFIGQSIPAHFPTRWVH